MSSPRSTTGRSKAGRSKTGKSPAKKKSSSGDDFLGLSKKLVLNIFDLMLKSRALEERLIKIYKTGEAFFWIGGPGEEAYGVPLGLLSKPGKGPDYDYYHLHYRCTPTVLALGVDPVHAVRLIMNKESDVCTGGRNFSNHYCFPDLNVTPVSSPIEIQYGLALGTARAQKRAGKKALSIVTGGDAGTAEGDFATCLVWASRPNDELPILITVQNNGWGISTSYTGQHGEEHISDRGKAFGIKSMTINGNDPVESYVKIKEAMDYIRKEQKPVLMEAHVSRLFGHSSASGANPEKNVDDPIELFKKRLIKAGYLKDIEATEIKKSYEDNFYKMFKEVQKEKGPDAKTIWDHTYYDNENADWRSF